LEIFKLFGSILINSDQADASLKKTDSNAQKVGNTLGKSIGTAVKWGAGIALAAGAAAVGIVALINKTVDNAAAMKKLSVATQLSINDTQEWAYIFKKTGSSTEVMTGAINKLGITMGKADDESKKATQAFKDLGININDVHGKLKPTGTLFEESITKLAGMKNMTERNILAQRLFGGSYSELLPILNRGSAGLEDLKKRAHDLGFVMSDEGVLAAAKYKKSMTDLKEQFSSVGTKIMTGLLPYLAGFATWVTANMPTIQAVMKIAFTDIGIAIKIIGGFITNTLIPIFNNLSNWIKINFPTIKKIFLDTLKALQTAYDIYVKPAITFILATFKSVYDWVILNMPIIKATFKTAFDDIKKVIDDVSTAMSKVIDWCKKYQEILIPLAAGIVAGGIVFGIYTLAIGAMTLATTIWASITAIAIGAGIAFGVVLAFITSPIGIVVIAIGLLVAAFVYAWRNIDGFKGAVLIAFNFIKNIITTALNFIINNIMFVLNSIKSFWNTWGNTIMAYVSICFNNIKIIINTVINVVKDIINTIMAIIKGDWKGAWDNIVKAVRDTFGGIGAVITNILDGVKKIFTGFGTAALKIGKDIMGSIIDGIKAKIKSIESTVSDVKDAIVNKFKSLFKIHSHSKVMQDIGVNIGGGIIDGLIKGLNPKDILAQIGNTVSGITGAFSGAGGNLAGWINSAMAITGIDPNNFKMLYSLIMHESGGNPNAINLWDSNAMAGHPSQGLMQTIPSTFLQYGIKALGGITNPIANIVAGIRYILARYTSVANVPGLRNMANGGKYVGYKVGSRYVPFDQVTTVHEGELIAPKSENPYANSGGSILGKQQINIGTMIVQDKGDETRNLAQLQFLSAL
jgi:hypothetical protein